MIPLSSEQVTYNCRLYNITLRKSAVVRDPLWGFLAGNVLFHNNNTVFVSAFLHFMDFNLGDMHKLRKQGKLMYVASNDDI